MKEGEVCYLQAECDNEYQTMTWLDCEPAIKSGFEVVTKFEVIDLYQV